MKLTENVLKQTIKEVISELLGEDMDEECPKGKKWHSGEQRCIDAEPVSEGD